METPTKKVYKNIYKLFRFYKSCKYFLYQGPKHAPGIVVRDGGSLLVTISEQGRVVKFTPVNSSMQQALDLVAEKKPIPVPSTEVFIQVFAQEKKDKKKVRKSPNLARV
jgi:hypothetical protein